MYFRWAEQTLNRYGYALLSAGAFCLPLKLTWAYCFLIPLVVLWLAGCPDKIKYFRDQPVRLLTAFIAMALIASIFGLAPQRSIPSCGKLFFFSLLVPVSSWILTRRGVVGPLMGALLGQGLAACCTIVHELLTPTTKRLFQGAVTESGQLGFMTVIAAGAALDSRLSRSTRITCGVLSILFLIALLVNLKRGPWVGVFVGLSLLLLVQAKKLVVPLVIAAFAIALSVPSLRGRLAASSEHFFIMGGRNDMWNVGADLATRFPLGIGFHNSPFLRNFSSEIPAEHSHFHNNFINVLVECGWFAFALFLAWLVVLVQRGFSARHQSTLALAIACAIVSWQVAGLVEYNFGDSEVRNLVFIQLGLLLALTSHATAHDPISLKPSEKSELAH